MARRGRPPLGAAHAQRVEGSQEAKDRLELILKTIGGELTVAEACDRLGVSEAHFHRLRERALVGAAEALEARPAGRPPTAEPLEDPRVAELREQVSELELELRASQVREELALVMPQVLQPPDGAGAEKKKRRPKRKRGGRWGKRSKRSADES